MRRSVAIPTVVHQHAMRHLLRQDEQEDLCFALWNPSSGVSRETALIFELVLPGKHEREVHGNVSFRPEYFERAVILAQQRGCGLALLHSHLGPGWQGMSEDDIRAEEKHAAPTIAATGLPLVGLTAGTDEAWSARFWERSGVRRYKRQWCESVRVIGNRIVPTYCEELLPKPRFRDQLTRTVSAWGEMPQANLARLRIGVIGAGSVGSIVAETLARMGVSNVDLFDFDIVEQINLDRLLHATERDATRKRLKVEMIAACLKSSATADPFQVGAYDLSIIEEIGFRRALDCDVLFSCVDRPWPRFVLNFIAYAHLIPVIDGGIKLERNASGAGLKRGTWRAHVAAPTRLCLECLGQYDPADVSLEQAGMLDNPVYIDGLPKDHPFRSHENVFPFSLSVASMEVMLFLRMVIPHLGNANIGTQTQDFASGLLDIDMKSCKPNCPFCQLVGQGDRSGITVTGRHEVAERGRANQKARKLPRWSWWPWR
jgi:hypothetical protein